MEQQMSPEFIDEQLKALEDEKARKKLESEQEVLRIREEQAKKAAEMEQQMKDRAFVLPDLRPGETAQSSDASDAEAGIAFIDPKEQSRLKREAEEKMRRDAKRQNTETLRASIEAKLGIGGGPETVSDVEAKLMQVKRQLAETGEKLRKDYRHDPDKDPIKTKGFFGIGGKELEGAALTYRKQYDRLKAQMYELQNSLKQN